MSTTIETPSDAPVAELSLDDIVAQELAAADASGTAVAKDGEPAPQGGSDASSAHTAADAGSTPAPATGEPAAETPPADGDQKPADDLTAARARKILAEAERKLAEAKEAGGRSEEAFIAEFLKSPKAFLAKFGKTIDDAIDASVAEGKVDPPAADDDNPRLTALERRIEEREQAEIARQQQTAIDNRKAEIAREIKGSAKYPLINEADRAQAVVDFMIEYHSIHGKAIGWQAAAGMIESDLKATGEKIARKLGWTPPAAKPAAAAPVKDRPGTTSIGGAQSTGAQTTPAEPEDPEKLMAHLVREAGLSA